ncbi:MAG: DUF1223 domain-containing protein [Alphaproteobacteria bacterium]|nr:DUF1223 domain-containing protein [Alphaproteobacteria bacterium]
MLGRIIKLITLAIMGGCGISAFPAFAEESPAVSAVVEIFTDTKDSCGYDDNGEQAIKDIQQEAPDVLVLTCHDAYVQEPQLPSEEDEAYGGYCRKRKVEYAGDHKLYTFNIPMVMINGRYDMNAGYPSQIPAGINMALSFSEIKPISLSLTEDGMLTYTLSSDVESSAQKIGGDYKIMLVAYRTETDLRDGDMRSVINPVTAVRDLGMWNKQPQNFSIPVTGLEHGDLAILVQQKLYGPIIAAGRISYP